MHRLTLYLNLWSLTTYIRIISKDTIVTKSKRRRIVNLMSNYTSSDFSVRKTSTFYNFFPAHCTTIMLPTTATTSEATHCRLSDNIPIIMESTMTTTSKSFFFLFLQWPQSNSTPTFFLLVLLPQFNSNWKEKKSLKSLLLTYNLLVMS